MIRAQMGLLVGRPHLEKGCLTVERDGDDVQMNMSIGGFCTSLSFLLFFSCVFFFLGCLYVNRLPYNRILPPDLVLPPLEATPPVLIHSKKH